MAPDRDTLRSAWRDERARLCRLADDLQVRFDDIVAGAELTSTDDEHDPEGATIAFERSQVAALVAQARRHLAEVDAAIQRLEDGDYGTCVRCGEPIPAARLEARPSAATCIGCASSER